MLKTKVMPKKQTSLRVEQQTDLQEVLYILKNNENTFPKMNNNSAELIIPIVRYHHAQNQRYVEKKFSEF